MDFFSLFKNLNFNNWYDVLIVLSFVFCILFLFIPVQILNNSILAAFAFSFLFLAFGCKNIIQRGIGYAGEGKIACTFGVIMLILGIACFVIGMYLLFL
jgi:hypothetical protein